MTAGAQEVFVYVPPNIPLVQVLVCDVHVPVGVAYAVTLCPLVNIHRGVPAHDVGVHVCEEYDPHNVPLLQVLVSPRHNASDEDT
ncbi:TPA: hypothetical protein DEP21_00215 [Patescibacteria group bacterium]|nr:hypothetical protein [Candidatus Gracilibacteria bacterium]